MYSRRQEIYYMLQEIQMEKKIKIQVRDLNLYYGQNHALHGVNMDIKETAWQRWSDRQDVVSLHF